MKFFLTILLTLLALVCWAAEWDPGITLGEIAVSQGIPVRELIKDLPDTGDMVLQPGTTLEESGLTAQDIETAVSAFEERTMMFGFNIVGLGMLVVFISLVLVGLIIGSLKHFEKKSKPQKTGIRTSVGTITTNQPDISQNAVVAVVMALHMHVTEARERKKLMLTWSRAPISMWRASNKTNMPNTMHSMNRNR